MTQLHAAPINFYFTSGPKISLKLKSLLIERYDIPANLIEIIRVKKCKSRNEGLIEICTQESGETIILSADKDFITKSLPIFKN
jgi:hypothetical protein